MRLLMVGLLLIGGCVTARAPSDERAARCVSMTFAWRNMTRGAAGPVMIRLEDRTDAFRDLGVYEQVADGLRPLGRFRVWNDRRMQFVDPATGAWEPAGWCD